MALTKGKTRKAKQESKPVPIKGKGTNTLHHYFRSIEKPKPSPKPTPRYGGGIVGAPAGGGSLRPFRRNPVKITHNFQGFPVEQCWFSDRDCRFYYVPQEYVKMWPRAIKLYREEYLYNPCEHCWLGSCFAIGRLGQLKQLCEQYFQKEKKPSSIAEIPKCVENIIDKMGCAIGFMMGEAYGQPEYILRTPRLWRPRCALAVARLLLRQKMHKFLEPNRSDQEISTFVMDNYSD